MGRGKTGKNNIAATRPWERTTDAGKARKREEENVTDRRPTIDERYKDSGRQRIGRIAIADKPPGRSLLSTELTARARRQGCTFFAPKSRHPSRTDLC